MDDEITESNYDLFINTGGKIVWAYGSTLLVTDPRTCYTKSFALGVIESIVKLSDSSFVIKKVLDNGVRIYNLDLDLIEEIDPHYQYTKLHSESDKPLLTNYYYSMVIGTFKGHIDVDSCGFDGYIKYGVDTKSILMFTYDGKLVHKFSKDRDSHHWKDHFISLNCIFTLNSNSSSFVFADGHEVKVPFVTRYIFDELPGKVRLIHYVLNSANIVEYKIGNTAYGPTELLDMRYKTINKCGDHYFAYYQSNKSLMLDIIDRITLKIIWSECVNSSEKIDIKMFARTIPKTTDLRDIINECTGIFKPVCNTIAEYTSLG